MASGLASLDSGLTGERNDNLVQVFQRTETQNMVNKVLYDHATRLELRLRLDVPKTGMAHALIWKTWSIFAQVAEQTRTVGII
jgi:hypothetical protein